MLAIKKSTIILIIATVIVLAIGLFTVSRTMQGNDDALQSVSLRLKWLDQAQFAGYYWAKETGAYEDTGIDVRLEPGGPDISPMQMVVSGANDFGVIGADQILSQG